MADVTSLLFDDPDGGTDGVVELPNLVEGRLADLLAAASAPGTPNELRGLERARSLFGSVSTTWPKQHGFRRSTRVAVVAASMVGLFATTSALAAASALPTPVARAVDGALHQIDINVSPAASSPAAVANQPAAVTGPLTVAEAKVYRSRAGSVLIPHCTLGSATGSHPGSCGVPSTSSTTGRAVSSSNEASNGKASNHEASNDSAALRNYKKLAQEAAAQGRNEAPASKATTGKHGSGSTTSKSGSGHGGNRGGNKSTGSGSGSGTGTGHGGNRGGNKSTGSGSGSGTGTGHGGNRGGNKSTGGGHKRTGSGKKKTKKHDRRSGTGTNTKGRGTGSREVDVSG
jgi:hypothetical protein